MSVKTPGRRSTLMGPSLTYGQGPMNVETPAHTWVRITRFFEPSDAQTHVCSSVASVSQVGVPNVIDGVYDPTTHVHPTCATLAPSLGVEQTPTGCSTQLARNSVM